MIRINSKRHDEIKSYVLYALERGNSFSLPVQIKKIVRSFPNIRLIPFSKQMKRRNLKYSEMVEFTQSKDACTDYYARQNIYIIYYNDIDKNIVSSNRYRWNIAHELGHVLLNHHVLSKKTRIFRSSLTDYEYNLLEEEADYFTQLLLVPHAPLYALMIQNATNIQLICKISVPAALKRFRDYIEWKSHLNSNDEYDNALYHFYYKFIWKRKCFTCGANLIQSTGNYCPICGNKTLRWGDGDMIYTKIEAHNNGKIKRCPVCDNEETDMEGSYCQFCGIKLVNYCSNCDCNYEDSLPTNARYCPVCGCNSTFLNSGILKKWDYKELDGFLNIPDGIDEELPFYVNNTIDENLPFN